MRYVFVDEAGTSETEPATIVAGLIVNADRQMMLAEAAIEEALGAVPEPFSSGFVFHATDVFSNQKYRKLWPLTDRLALLHSMMRLPRRLKIPFSFGLVRRESPNRLAGAGISRTQWHHINAFTYCLARADMYIREFAAPNEVATVVAEDVPEMRKFLKQTPGLFRQVILSRAPLRPTTAEKNLGYIKQKREIRIARIRKAIHFVQKEDDPMLQLADATAFGLRRYFAGQQFGDEFASSIFGANVPPREDFEGLENGLTFHHGEVYLT